MTSILERHDKLLGMNLDENKLVWNGECPYCSSKQLLIHPIDISYQPHTINDYSDLPLDIRGYYSTLPNIVEAIIKCVSTNKDVVNNREYRDNNSHTIIVECISCKQCTDGFFSRTPEGVMRCSPDKTELKKYVSRLYGAEEVMRL